MNAGQSSRPARREQGDDPLQTILRSGVFDSPLYCAAAGLEAATTPAVALAHYLGEGEAAGLCPHDLFIPDFVRRQLAALGLAVQTGSVLATYLLNPDAPLNPHPLFDRRHFARRDAGRSHLEDYVQRRLLGEIPPAPTPLFDPAFYYDSHPDVAARNVDAFTHYVRSGWKENRQPHPLFDGAWWRLSLAALGLEPPAGNPLSAYCTDSSTWGAATHPLFDPRHFHAGLAHSGLIPRPQMPPLIDCLERQPEVSGHALFDCAFYRAGARELGMEVAGHALLHYARGAGQERVDPHPLFCEAFYAQNLGDAARPYRAHLEHFLRSGQARGRDPNPLFSPTYYRAANPGIARDEESLLEHYLAHADELLDPHPLFDARAYALRYPECLESGETPLGHYCRSWAEAGVRFPGWGTALVPRRDSPRDLSLPEVLVVSHELSRTGAPAIVLNIVRDLVMRRGLRVWVLAMSGGELLEEFREWAPVIDLSLSRAAGIRHAAFVAMLRASLRGRLLPRLMIVNTACVDQTVVTFEGEVPVATLVHELASGFPEDWFRAIYERSHLVIYPAEYVRSEAQRLYQLPAAKAAVAPQGLLDPAFGSGDGAAARAAVLEEIGAEPEAFLVLGCGTLDQRKGLDTFVHLAGLMLRSVNAAAGGRPLHFLWIGGGPTHRTTVDWYARQDLRRGGLEQRVHLLGPRSSTEAYFLACDCFVVTSRMDPFPCVVHEAMACAKPVVLFANAGGGPEALGVDAGIVVDYGDLAAMAEEILRLRRDPAHAAGIGARALARVRTRYVFSDYVDRILSLVRERAGVEFPPPPAASVARPRRRVVVTTCGEEGGPDTLSDPLVAALCERGFDAELIHTGDPRTLVPRRGAAFPQRYLGRLGNRPVLHKERFDALARVLEAAAPVILIHNLDPLAAALASVPLRGVGVLGVVSDASETALEQAARLGPYWQRVVTSTATVAEEVLAAAPSLIGRVTVIPRAGESPRWDAYAELLAAMFDELRSRSYVKPAASPPDPVFGALSLPPAYRLDPTEHGFLPTP